MKSAHCIMLSLHNMNSDYYLFYFYYYVMQITIIIIYFITCSLDKKITILKLAARHKDVCSRTCGAVVAIKRTPRHFFLSARLSLRSCCFFFSPREIRRDPRSSRFHLADKCARICVTQSPMITKINHSESRGSSR